MQLVREWSLSIIALPRRGQGNWTLRDCSIDIVCHAHFQIHVYMHIYTCVYVYIVYLFSVHCMWIFTHVCIPGCMHMRGCVSIDKSIVRGCSQTYLPTMYQFPGVPSDSRPSKVEQKAFGLRMALVMGTGRPQNGYGGQIIISGFVVWGVFHTAIYIYIYICLYIKHIHDFV